MKSFVKVAEHQGFAPAARELGLSTTAVSRYVQEFEGWLGTELLRRTTRKVTLTEHGQLQLEKCLNILSDVHNLRAEFRDMHADPSGTLKITAPAFIGKRFLASILPTFLNTYSKLNVEILATDREVNLVSEGFDAAVRIGKLSDSTLIARKLHDVKLELVCSPDYVSRNGKPQNLKELARHRCLIDTVPSFGDRWPIKDATVKRNFRANGHVRANSGELIESFALNGVGIACLPDFFVLEHLMEGRLVRLLPHLESPDLGMYAVYPQSKFLAPKIRAFVDFLVAHIEQLRLLYYNQEKPTKYDT